MKWSFYEFRLPRRRLARSLRSTWSCPLRTRAWVRKRPLSSRRFRFRRKFLVVPSKFWQVFVFLCYINREHYYVFQLSMLIRRCSKNFLTLEWSPPHQDRREGRRVRVGSASDVEHRAVQLRSPRSAGKKLTCLELLPKLNVVVFVGVRLRHALLPRSARHHHRRSARSFHHRTSIYSIPLNPSRALRIIRRLNSLLFSNTLADMKI